MFFEVSLMICLALEDKPNKAPKEPLPKASPAVIEQLCKMTEGDWHTMTKHVFLGLPGFGTVTVKYDEKTRSLKVRTPSSEGADLHHSTLVFSEKDRSLVGFSTSKKKIELLREQVSIAFFARAKKDEAWGKVIISAEPRTKEAYTIVFYIKSDWIYYRFYEGPAPSSIDFNDLTQLPGLFWKAKTKWSQYTTNAGEKLKAKILVVEGGSNDNRAFAALKEDGSVVKVGAAAEADSIDVINLRRHLSRQAREWLSARWKEYENKAKSLRKRGKVELR